MTTPLTRPLTGPIGLHEAARALGASSNVILKRLRARPEVRALFRLIGTAYVIPGEDLPKLAELLGQKGTL